MILVVATQRASSNVATRITMATEIRMRNPKTGEESTAYEGYSWTSLLFGGFPALLRGDVALGLGVFLLIVVAGGAAFATGLPTFLASGIVGGIWGFFYNDIHSGRLRREGYQVVAPAPVTATTTEADGAHGVGMADSGEVPVMLPFQDKEGTGWHVVIRYHAGHERRIDGFATENQALEWIVANSQQVDK
jgi:hypothetical protein